MILVKVKSIKNIFNHIMESYDWNLRVDANIEFKKWFETEFNCKMTYTQGVSWWAETLTFSSEEDYFLFLMKAS